MDYTIISTLRQLCIKHITDAIWMCSCNPETEGDADHNFIYQEIKNWYKQMKEKESVFNV